jgi:uncharacterized protein YeaO (DUF488 family)
MGTEVYPDISEHSGHPVNDQFRGRWLAYRAVDGTYSDELFTANDAWATACKRLAGYIVYLVWPRSVGHATWTVTLDALFARLGRRRRRRLVIMQDVESWDRFELRRDFSAELEAQRAEAVHRLHAARPDWQRGRLLGAYYRDRDERRVIGYGNRGDLEMMAPGVKWRWIVLADYSDAPTPKRVHTWDVIARQFTDLGVCGPWNRVDLNRAQVGPYRLARRLGLGVLRWRIR